MNRSDQQLIEDYFKGDEKSLEALIQRYLKPIYSFTYRYVNTLQDAEDITQETFVKAWKNLKKFDQNKSFKTWIFFIAKNIAIDFLKKKKTIPFSEFSDNNGKNIIIETLVDSSLLPDKLVEKSDFVQVLNLAIAKLSPKYRKVLSLRYSNGFNFREIAEFLGESLNTVKSQHRRALTILKRQLLVFSS